MYPTLMKIVPIAIAAIVLAACGREQARPAIPAEAGKDTLKADANKGSKADDAPRVVDPIKEGY